MAYITTKQFHWHLSGNLVTDEANAVLVESAQLPMEEELMIDFANVKAIDSATVALMIAWMRRAKEESIVLQFSNVPKNLKSLTHLYGVDDILKT